MRAVVHDRYGPPEVLRLVDRPDPIPADNEAETVRIGAWYELEIPLPLVRHFGGQTLMIRPSNITIHRRRFGLTVDGEIDFDAIVRPRRD